MVSIQEKYMIPSAAAEHFWFLDSLVSVRVSMKDGHDGISILESQLPYGSSPPMHIHHTEDEVFHILEGEFRIALQGKELRLGPGDIVLAPRGVPHTYRVDSPAGGRCLTITVRGDFERFVRELGRPPERPGLPATQGPPSPEAIQLLTKTAAKYGIELVGPPLS
jgi:mannose-6-phosphate isomerase-like protein (cupin superfamily)